MANAFAPDSLDRPTVDALAVAVLVALAVTVGTLFDLRATVIAGAVLIGAGGYAFFRLVYALEAIAEALEESGEPRAPESRRRGPRP